MMIDPDDPFSPAPVPRDRPPTTWQRIKDMLSERRGGQPLHDVAVVPSCPTEDCPGDARYAAPGRGHLTHCNHPAEYRGRHAGPLHPDEPLTRLHSDGSCTPE